MTTAMDLSDALAAAVERVAGAVLAVHGRPRLPSTGVHWRPGLVVTAHHAVAVDREVTLTAADGTAVTAQVAGRDPTLDVAVLRAETGRLPVADLADDSELRVGHLVLAVGEGPRASAGIVSALDAGGRSRAGEIVAVDLTLYPGFSGGPLVDVRGRVVGLTTSGASRHLQAAIRAAAVSRVVEQVARHGRIPRPYLGIGTQPVELPEALRQRQNLAQRSALVVVEVRSGSPAAAAGVMVGDVIAAVAGHPTAEPADLARALSPDRVGTVVTLSLFRGGEPREVEVRVGERPAR